MINFIKQIFSPKTKNAKLDNSISFILDEDRENVLIKISINDLDTDMAKKFGSLIFHVSEGYYVEGVLEVLTTIGQQSPEHHSFIQRVCNNWGKNLLRVEQEENNDTDPIIAPSKFSSTIDN